MQALIIDNKNVFEELGNLGLSSSDIKSFSGSNIHYIIKLGRLSISTIPLLKNEASSLDISVILSRRSGRSAPFSEAILSGSKDNLIKLSKKLSTGTGDSADLGNLLSKTIDNYEKNIDFELVLGSHRFKLGDRTLVMGILNVTPDSFSDGGKHNTLERALEQAFNMVDEGADIIDIGGESTRPGHETITTEEELKRVLPVIQALKKDSSFKTPLSIDTYKSVVAEQALYSGADMVNDIWGFKKSKKIGPVAAKYDVPVCLMHNKDNTDYDDLIPDILSELEECLLLAYRAGISKNNIIIDPGIGFGKNVEQNLEVMKHLASFCNLGYPLLLGTSRKSIIGKTLDLPVEERVEGTAATVAYGITAGADIVRVHDVKEMSRVVRMTDAIVRR